MYLNTSNPKECCGCRACLNICPKDCIDMCEDKNGFVYPTVNLSLCSNCGLCKIVCPIKTLELNAEPFIFIGRHKKKECIEQASSGGAFESLYTYCIANEYAVCGACLTEEFEVKHSIAYSMEDCEEFRKSKYVQSNTGLIFRNIRELIKKGKRYCSQEPHANVQLYSLS